MKDARSFEQQLQQTARSRKTTDTLVICGMKSQGVRSLIRRHHLFVVQLLALKFDFTLLFLPGHFQATATNELDNPAQLVAIEPGTVAFANVDDDAGATREIDAIHQLPTLRTRQVANLIRLAI